MWEEILKMSTKLSGKNIKVDIRFTIGENDCYRIVRTNKKTLIYKNGIKYSSKKVNLNV